MAELIDKGTLRRKLLEKQVTTYYDNMEKREAIGETVALLDTFPTTTEAEIRAKAIDRFLTEMLNEFDSRYADIEEHTGSYVVSRLCAVAEQLKE